ncbi:DNA-3-methyladenine glycosylase II [Croceifilum oryzae]|uniref:DNA-3-methyladenine glycosylase II n=1 Tax=Croceifilum oryzae TaxID=1553429 RepID=A0AAJ1THW5_9BACL|nr:DNA-3-methyladenine glycosylase [Croceifilum oryzae]MDQ0418809.1 DNA-3-methyladenine glycosylase II [Croceifilum oryzae]
MKLTIPLPKEYSFEKTIERVKEFEKATEHEKDKKLWRAIRLSSRAIVVGVCKNEAGELEIESHDKLSRFEQMELKEIMTHRWSLEVDLTPFYKRMAQNPILYSTIPDRMGFHIVRDPDLYECLIRTIISQQLNLSFAGTLIHRFIEQFGEKISHLDMWFSSFPTVERVADLNYEDLTTLQLTQRKAEYIIDLSRAIVEGKLDLSSLQQETDEEIMKRLISFRGIGRWTVECLLMFGYGRSNVLPAADIGLRNALQLLYGSDTRPSETEVREFAKDWSPYASYVTFYLWDYLTQQKKISKVTKKGYNER